MTAIDILKGNYNEYGDLSVDEVVKKEVVKNYSGATGHIEKIWQKNFGDESLKFHLQELFDYIGDYNQLIAQFNGKDKELDECASIDSYKRIKHNALISQICIINRYLNKKSANISNILPFKLPSDPYELLFRTRITAWAQEIYLDLSKIKRELN